MTTPPHSDPPAPPPVTSDDERREEARVYVQQVRAFQIHAAVFAAGMVVIFLVNLFTNIAAGIAGEWSAWWSVWALIGWGLGITVHGLVVWLARPGSSSRVREEQQIDKVLKSMDAQPHEGEGA